jgi:class 3 adenylate cyclase
LWPCLDRSGAHKQVAGLRQLHKADPVGRGYTVVGFGSQCVQQMLSLALSIQGAAAALNARNAAAVGAAGGVRVEWRVRVGVARGNIVTGGMGLQRQRCHFFGGAVAEAVRLARECPAGETLVQRALSKAEGAQAFAFTHSLGAASGAGAVVGLTERRIFTFGGGGAGVLASAVVR